MAENKTESVVHKAPCSSVCCMCCCYICAAEKYAWYNEISEISCVNFIDSTIQKVYNHFVTRHEAALSLRRSEGLHIFLNIYIETGEEPLRHEAFPDFSPHAAELSGKFTFGRI